MGVGSFKRLEAKLTFLPSDFHPFLKARFFAGSFSFRAELTLMC